MESRTMKREVICQNAIDYEYPPDGGKVPVIDAYDGCQINCPYCFQWNDPSWNHTILVKTNLPEVLDQELKTWNPAEAVYVGSRGDPYQPLEDEYGLTRRTLEIIRQYEMPCYINTKSDSRAFRRDFDLFASFGERLIVCMGQANLPHLRATHDPATLPNIVAAQELARRDINVWVFITPVLPGMTNVHGMIQALPDTVPVYLDKVRLSDPASQRFFDYVKRTYPDLEARYRAIAATGTDPYYDELRVHYGDNPRVNFVFGEA
jgi:DNA repair photolyase